MAPGPPAMSAPMWLQAQPCHFGTVRFLILQLEGCRRAGVVPLGASAGRDPRRAHAGRHGSHGQPHEAQRQPRPRGGPFVRERQWSSARKEEFLRRSNAFTHWTPTSKQTRLPWRGRQPRGGEDPISSFVPGLLFFFFLQGARRRGRGRERAINHSLTEEKGAAGPAAGGGDRPASPPRPGWGWRCPPVPPSSSPQPGLAPSCPAVGLSSPPLLNPVPSPPARGHPLALPELPGTSAQPRSQVPREHGSLQTRGNGGFIYGRSCNPSPSAAPWP